MSLKPLQFYFDMDGVLAVFNKHIPYKQIRNTEGYFEGLSPISCMVDLANSLIHEGYDVYILTKAENNRIAAENQRWKDKYLPDLSVERMIVVPLDGHKSDYVEVSSDTILFDDYSANLVDWVRLNGTSVNVVTAINHSDPAFVNIEPMCNRYYNALPIQMRHEMLDIMKDTLQKDITAEFERIAELYDKKIIKI